MESAAARTILLVDDHQAFLTTLAKELGECSNGFCILTAENGERALRVLESEKVDLVVTDLKMPVMDGFGLITHMKSHYPSIPVIVLSSFLYPELETKIRSLQVSQCIDKQLSTIGAIEETILQGLKTA